MPKEKDKIPDTASASCLSYILKETSFYFFLTTAMLILFCPISAPTYNLVENDTGL